MLGAIVVAPSKAFCTDVMTGGVAGVVPKGGGA
jgi:hypothetical protein